ncbi:magnesium transporter CorA family protein [Candidatus Kaiserbacteria bacterium]|nr:magnesium transporter CorA family protein [Candidatus Kaiserbacteria bacterium]
MITRYFRTLKDSELKVVEATRSGVWVHVVDPSEVELDELATELGLEREILDDARDFFEVPRLERSGNATYFFTRYLSDDTDEDTDTAPLLIVMGETFVLTIALHPVPQFERFMTGREVVHTTQKTKLFIQIMQAVTRSFERQLITLRRLVHRDRAKLRKIGNREIVRFVSYENRLNDMVAAVMPTNTALQQVMNGHFMPVYEDDRELMDDLRIDNAQVVESARSLLKTIQNVRNAAEAILANTLNNRIKTLTVLTILLTIPTIVFSFFGMNVMLPLAHTNWAVMLVLIITGAIVLGALVWFKKNEWL